MTEHELELRLRDWYRDHVDTLAGDGSPAEMRSRVLEIPSRLAVASRATEPRRLILLAAAMLMALLVGGAIAIGAGLLRLPWLPDDPTERSDGLPGNGWIVYSAALTSWNTPGGPAVETPGGPARLILTAPDGAVQFIGDQPPGPGEPTDEWLSVRQRCPAFSPDGSHLAFAEQAVDVSQGFPIPVDMVIAGINGQGTWEETLRVRGGCPVWSPDGQLVAFARSGADRPLIGIAGLDGTTDRLARPDGEALLITAVAWSPDGSALAVVDSRYPNGFSAEGRLWLVPVDGSDPTLLHEGHTPLDGIPAWSPDGNRIAFTASATPEPTPNDEGVAAPFEPDWRVLLVVATGGGVAEEVGPGVGPAWSPQGDRLAYLDGAGRITVVDIVTDARRIIPDAPIPPGTELSDYNNEGGGGIWRPHPPRWSPDGKRLLFVGTDGTWGTSVLLSASPEGDEVPVAVSQTWVAEWLGDAMFSWQPVLDEP